MKTASELFSAPSAEAAERGFSNEKNKWYQILPRKYRRQIKRQVIQARLGNQSGRSSPDFFIIGAMKCGTSSLFTYLAQHPDIVPPLKKEIHYFNNNFDLGNTFYAQFFPWAKDLLEAPTPQGRQVTFEATPDYIYHPLAAERLSRTFPETKLILLVRDPVSRTFSHFKQQRRFSAEPLEFEEALYIEEQRLKGEIDRLREGDPYYYSFRHHLKGYLARSRYAEQLKRYQDLFPAEQILVLSSEEFFSNTARVFRRIESFLGLRHADGIEFEHIFPGIPGEVTAEQRRKLAAYFAPHNDAFFSMIGEQFDWL